MKTLVVDRTGVASPELLATAERRIFFTLARFEGELTRVELVIYEAKGARKGLHLGCDLAVLSRRVGEVRVASRGAELSAVTNDVIDRMGRTLARRLDPVTRGLNLRTQGIRGMGER
jgi:hypothetical protein